MSKRSVKKSEQLVKQYAPMFGLAHYRWSVTALDEEKAAPKGNLWGCSNFNHNEEYFDIAVVPDGTLGDTEHRHLILHELAHGILTYAVESESHCETACDRIAKALIGPDATGPNYNHCGGPNRTWEEFDNEDDIAIRKMMSTSRSRKNWDDDKDKRIVKILDSLPDLSDRERYVLGALYVQGLSFRQVAKNLGVSARTVTRIRNQMVKRLAERV